MKKEKFLEFWNGAVDKWNDATFSLKKDNDDKNNKDDKEKTQIIKYNAVCSIKPNAAARIYQNYLNIKQLVKKLYFKEEFKKISRYKRAAVIIYAVIVGEDPLIYKNKDQANKDLDFDVLFLKQRFAFHLALTSLIQDYEDVQGKPVFFFSELGVPENPEDDDFLTSVYKDILFSENYHNYNVLTMANMLGLLVERASTLKTLKKHITQ